MSEAAVRRGNKNKLRSYEKALCPICSAWGDKTGWPCEVEAVMESYCDVGYCPTDRSNANRRIAFAIRAEVETVPKSEIWNQKQTTAEVTY